ncbi:MAG: His/Gly/Thr/Pro-type tRNA ligase C-terminal domain-containing protein, partial [bacterium]
YLDENNVEQFVWQTSWGVSTRMIGGLIMAHSDDNGLVLPPKMATNQVVITTIFAKPEDEQIVNKKAEEIALSLKDAGVRVKVDSRDLRPGEKFYGWEKKGVPIRLEIGPKDVANNSLILARRDTGEKETVQISEVVKVVTEKLETIQKDLLSKARAFRESRTKPVDTWEDFKQSIEEGYFVSAHWDGTAETEAKIKEETAATIRCIPFDQPEESGKCVLSANPSSKRVIFARAY